MLKEFYSAIDKIAAPLPADRRPAEDSALDLQVLLSSEHLLTFMKDFLESLEKQNAATVEDLVRKYKTIGPLLGKIEGIIEGKNTLKSSKMKSYYQFWEKRIFNALNRVLLLSVLPDIQS